jgi:hypothetical protein
MAVKKATPQKQMITSVDFRSVPAHGKHFFEQIMMPYLKFKFGEDAVFATNDPDPDNLPYDLNIQSRYHMEDLYFALKGIFHGFRRYRTYDTKPCNNSPFGREKKNSK